MQTSVAHNFVFCTWDIKVTEFIELPIMKSVIHRAL